MNAFLLRGAVALSFSALGAVVAQAQSRGFSPPSTIGAAAPQTSPEGTVIQPWPWMEAWSGAGVTNHFFGGWMGGVIALNDTRNVWADGLVIRLEGMAGQYNYRTASVPSGKSTVPMEGAGLMVGYRKVFGSTTLTGYVGVNVENNQNRDPLARVRGTEVGVRVLGELYSRLSSFQDLYAQASFSGAFDKWNVLVRPGFSVWQDVWVGPEAQVFGNKGSFGASRYAEGRVGGFVQFQFPGQTLTNIIISGGYTTPVVKNQPHDGYYMQIGASYRF